MTTEVDEQLVDMVISTTFQHLKSRSDYNHYMFVLMEQIFGHAKTVAPAIARDVKARLQAQRRALGERTGEAEDFGTELAED